MSKEIDPNNPADPILEMSPEEQALADKLSGKTPDVDEEGNPIELPSDKKTDDDPEPKKFADKYDTVDDLRKGIDEIGSDLPEYVLEGMSDEALVKHYEELQKNFHENNENKEGRKHADKKTDEEDPDNPDDKGGKPEGVSEELWTELGDHFEKNGNITEEHYNQLNKAGIPDEVIDRYIDSIQNEQVKFTESIYDIAGGQEQYETIKSWVEENYPADEIEAVSRMDKKGMLLAMKGMKADYDAANPVDTSKRIMGNPFNTSTGSYGSQADYIIDVSDKRYGVDKRYTKAVDDKFANSKNLQ